MTEDRFHPTDDFSRLVAAGQTAEDLVLSFEKAMRDDGCGPLEVVASVAIAKALEYERDLHALSVSAPSSRALPVLEMADAARPAPPGGPLGTVIPIRRVPPTDGAA